MKRLHSERRILHSFQPVQTPPIDGGSVPELPETPAPPRPKTKGLKQLVRDAIKPIATAAALVASSADAGAQQQAPTFSAQTDASSSTNLGTLGQQPNLSKSDLERFIRSTDLLDAIAQASPGLLIENAPMHQGGTGRAETSEGWIHQIGEFLKDDAGEIAKHLLNEPIEELIKDYIIARYAPNRVKGLYSKQAEKKTAETGYTPYRTSDAQTLPGFYPMLMHLEFETPVKLNQPYRPSTGGGGQSASSAAADSQTDVATPEPARQAESIRALEEENRLLRRQIAELKNINQAKKQSASRGAGQD